MPTASTTGWLIGVPFSGAGAVGPQPAAGQERTAVGSTQSTAVPSVGTARGPSAGERIANGAPLESWPPVPVLADDPAAPPAAPPAASPAFPEPSVPPSTPPVAVPDELPVPVVPPRLPQPPARLFQGCQRNPPLPATSATGAAGQCRESNREAQAPPEADTPVPGVAHESRWFAVTTTAPRSPRHVPSPGGTDLGIHLCFSALAMLLRRRRRAG